MGRLTSGAYIKQRMLHPAFLFLRNSAGTVLRLLTRLCTARILGRTYDKTAALATLIIHIFISDKQSTNKKALGIRMHRFNRPANQGAIAIFCLLHVIHNAKLPMLKVLSVSSAIYCLCNLLQLTSYRKALREAIEPILRSYP